MKIDKKKIQKSFKNGANTKKSCLNTIRKGNKTMKTKTYNITFEGVALTVDAEGNIYNAEGVELTQSPVKNNTAGNPYLTVKINGKNVLAHRVCAFAFFGVPARGEVCDHINGNKSDNRKINLRWVSRRENALNRHSYGDCRLPKCSDYHICW